MCAGMLQEGATSNGLALPPGTPTTSQIPSPQDKSVPSPKPPPHFLNPSQRTTWNPSHPLQVHEGNPKKLDSYKTARAFSSENVTAACLS